MTFVARFLIVLGVLLGSSALAQSLRSSRPEPYSFQHPRDQIALQLGAIQMGYNVPFQLEENPTAQQEAANALLMGRNALAATVASPAVQVQGAVNSPAVDTVEFRDQLYQAVEAVVTSPVVGRIRGRVSVVGSTTPKPVSARLSAPSNSYTIPVPFALEARSCVDVQLLREELVANGVLPPVLDPEGDEDGDGLTNGDEETRGTDPYDADSDNDGYSDGEEVAGGTDPLDPSSNEKLLGITRPNTFMLQSIQAGSTTEIDDLKVTDLDSGEVVYENDFSSDADATRGLRSYYWPQGGKDTENYVLNGEKTRVSNGKLILETTGFNANGSGGYDSHSEAEYAEKLPTNFRIEFFAKRLQWAGHFSLMLFRQDPNDTIGAYRVGGAYSASRISNLPLDIIFMASSGSVFQDYGIIANFNTAEKSWIEKFAPPAGALYPQGHKLAVELQGNIVRFYLNNILLNSAEISKWSLQNTSPDMITVEGGTLPEGSQLAGQTVSDFQIGKYEVTWGEWKEVRDWAVNNGYTDLAGELVGGTYPNPADNLPVINVSWYDVLKWNNARSEKDGLTPVYEVSGEVYRAGETIPSGNGSANGYRLPLEKEWEWAARGGVSSQGYTYSGSNDVDEVAWYLNNNIPNGTKAVGTKAANELGIYDMSGNVWEWCWDNEWSASAIARGGPWMGGKSFCEVNYSTSFGLDYRSAVGFRLARSSGN